ncbi:MAG: heparinase II/III family protein [Acidobacteria bacterium]|nr:heparinase II/III family protein [Acidobacteriota bacterium]
MRLWSLLLVVAAPLCAQTMTEADLWKEIDLSRPELAGVKAGDRHALAEYFRHRKTPRYFIAPGEMANPKPAHPDVARAEAALRHEVVSIGYPHTFQGPIDWHFDLTAEAGSKYAPNNEWTWQLNRHAEWVALSRAYRDTGDEKYAREFVAQMTQWARECPMPPDAANVPRSAWRTIETGIRAAQVWPELWYRFVLSPAMTDDALLTFLRAYLDHAHHLMAYHTTGNWLAMEGNGLFHVGVLFPEFKDAAAWRETAGKWIYDEMNNQVYPDGVQVELSSGYHHVSLNNFLATYKIAKLNGVALPGDFLKRLEKMYDFDVYGAMPDRRLPGVQDGNYYDVRRALAEGSEYFPERADFQWYATDGREGHPPAETSHAFEWAGYFVMRSGWERDARWLWFDGGPFGYGHQHEDKLEMIVEAYGKLLLVDPGTFTYERSKWRSYFIDSPSHNVVLVDGQPQRRRGAARPTYIAKAPAEAVWKTGAETDYVEATFDESYGGEVKRNVTHTRAVVFVKPDFWVVMDTLTAKDGKVHDYDALFHFDAPVKVDGLRVATQNQREANLTIAVRPDAGLSWKVIEGQADPVQGWLPDGMSKVRPAPVGVLSAHGTNARMIYALVPSRSGDAVQSVEGIGETGMRVSLKDGRTWEVRFGKGTASVTPTGGQKGPAGHRVF